MRYVSFPFIPVERTPKADIRFLVKASSRPDLHSPATSHHIFLC